MESTNNLHQNTSNLTDIPNSTSDLKISENSSHTTRYIPIIEEYATKIASFVNTDSSSTNTTNPKSPAIFQKSVSNTDTLELAKIEPSDYNNMINIQSLDVDKSGDSFIGPRIKSTKWASGTDTSFKNQYTNSKDTFCSKNSSMISFNDAGINPNESPTTETVDKKPPSNLNDFFGTKNSVVEIDNSSSTGNDEKSTTTGIYDENTPNPEDFCGKNTSTINPNGKIEVDGLWYTAGKGLIAIYKNSF